MCLVVHILVSYMLHIFMPSGRLYRHFTMTNQCFSNVNDLAVETKDEMCNSGEVMNNHKISISQFDHSVQIQRAAEWDFYKYLNVQIHVIENPVEGLSVKQTISLLLNIPSSTYNPF